MPPKRKPKRIAGKRRRRAAIDSGEFGFPLLVDAIHQVHEQCTAQAARTINVALTLRNWAIGAYITEYEQRGTDRAAYGEGLLGALAQALSRAGLERMDERELRRYRLLYLTYPGIRETASPEFNAMVSPVWQVISAPLETLPSRQNGRRCLPNWVCRPRCCSRRFPSATSRN